MIKVAAFTGGRDVPSARFRVRQYIGRLRSEGVDITEYPAPLSVYPPRNRLIRPGWGFATLATRIPGIFSSYRYDMTLLQREMLSTFVTLEPLAKRPHVLDVDDAIWLLRDGRFAERLARDCESIICGNAFLAEHFSRWNPRVSVIPTAVDTDRYVPQNPVEEPIIGWSGTSGGFRYLYAIEPVLTAVLRKVPGSRIRIVSDLDPSFRDIPCDRVEIIRWSPQNEVQAIQGMAIGVMPLEDSLWARGKCSYKMLTYMACGLPVVVSPVGMNGEILSQGTVGFGPKSKDEWISALCFLSENRKERVQMGKCGRQVVLEKYSIDMVAKALANSLLKTAGLRAR